MLSVQERSDRLEIMQRPLLALVRIDHVDDPKAFFDAVGDDARYQRNLAAMMESCQRFIDFDKIDVLPTSQYLLKAPAAG